MTAAIEKPNAKCFKLYGGKKEDQNSANKQKRVLNQVGLHFQSFHIKTESEQRLKSKAKSDSNKKKSVLNHSNKSEKRQ